MNALLMIYPNLGEHEVDKPIQNQIMTRAKANAIKEALAAVKDVELGESVIDTQCEF
mgnify:CR=1 FL=1